MTPADNLTASCFSGLNRTTNCTAVAVSAPNVGIIVRYTVYFLEALLIVVSNALTLAAVRGSKRLRQATTNTFIVSLAFADGTIGVILPATKLLALSDDRRVWMAAACVVSGPYYAMFCISLFTLLAIAVDRYVAVIHPLTYRTTATVGRARAVAVVIWLALIALWETMTCLYGTRIPDGQRRPRAAHDLFPRYAYFSLVQVVILLPIVGNVVIYVLIYVSLRRRRAVVSAGAAAGAATGAAATDPNQPSKRAKAFTKMMALVLGYLVVAWLPYYVLVPLYKLNDPSTPKWFINTFEAAAFLFYSNSFMNPVIYSWKNRDFREAYAKIFRCGKARSASEESTEATRPTTQSA